MLELRQENLKLKDMGKLRSPFRQGYVSYVKPQNKYTRKLITYDMKSKQTAKLRETWEDPVSNSDNSVIISSLSGLD